MSDHEIPGLLARLWQSDDIVTDNEILGKLHQYGGYDTRTSDLIRDPSSVNAVYVVAGKVWIVPRDHQGDSQRYEYTAATALERLINDPPEGMGPVADLWEYSRGTDGDLFPSFMTMVDIEDETGYFPAETLRVKGLGTEDARYLGAALSAWSRWGTEDCVQYVQALIRSHEAIDEDERGTG